MKALMPKPATLRKHGLTEKNWLAILKRQGGTCAVCRLLPRNGRLCIDHEHVKGWKKLKREQRRRYVRGLLCFFCNHYYMGRAITVMKAFYVYKYLVAYSKR